MKKKEISKKLSVVVCSKNEERRIEKCLRSIIDNKPDEIILVDGGSNDNTCQIAKKFKLKIIINKNSNLTKDRQRGLDAAKYNFVAMIDCDHFLKKNQLNHMLQDLQDKDFAILQAQIKIKNLDFWTNAEKKALDLVHNIPGLKKKIIGTAPNIYNKSKLKNIRFNSRITKTIDDTDFFYRLSQNKIRFGISKIKVISYHEPGFTKYFKKFIWYGKGDAEFCFKYKFKIFSMSYHLLVRYMIIYPLKSILNLSFNPVIFFLSQGFIRFLSMIINLFKIYYQILLK